MTGTSGQDARPALGPPGRAAADWLLPTEALDRFRPPEASARDQSRAPRREARYGFRVGSLNLLIKPRTASEVLATLPTAAIPNSPPWLLGMINLRSNLVPVFDLALICSLERGQEDRGRWILVLDKGEAAVGLIIDAQPVALAPTTPLNHLPSLPTALRGAVTGGFTIGSGPWLEFDHAAFFGALKAS